MSLTWILIQNLKSLIKKFFECNDDYNMDSFTNFEEEKQSNEERTLSSSLKSFKSIQYVFEVDGQQMISSDDSQGYSSSLIHKKYQRINEKNIQENIARMMQPLTMKLESPEKLTMASLQKLPLVKQSLTLESGSMTSESTCMASDVGSMSSARNSICSDHHEHHEETVMPVPPMPQNKWQRKHNRFILEALQLQKQGQQESYYYPSRRSSIIQQQISICDCCQVSVCVCANTSTTTSMSSTTNCFSNNNNHDFKHHESKPKKSVTFALDIDVASMPQKEKFSWPTNWLSAPQAKVATLCY